MKFEPQDPLLRVTWSSMAWVRTVVWVYLGTPCTLIQRRPDNHVTPETTGDILTPVQCNIRIETMHAQSPYFVAFLILEQYCVIF